MRKVLSLKLLLVTAIITAGPVGLRAEDGTPKYTVEEIMKAVFKGEDSAGKKVTKGKGTQADYDKLVEYLSSLPLNDPPQGDADGWKQKTTAVLNAAVALKEGKAGALAQFNTAVNCQACHRIYRPD
jgi:cytochrome c556